MSLSLFLKSAKARFAKVGLQASSQMTKLTLVIGNQSSDMDSVVSAIAYSYFSSKSAESTEGIIFPILNIPHDDLRLRRDIEHALDSIHIHEDDLIFTDDLISLPSGSKINLILVDHNNFAGENEEIISKKYDTHVVGIIDHHADEHKFLDANPRVIQVNGSCSSLVLDHFKKEVLSGNLDLPTVRFFVSAILQDTDNLRDTLKTEKTDIDILGSLQAKYPALTNEILNNENKLLHKLKKSSEGFSFRDILRKDYKEYQCGNLKTGISSVRGSLDELEKTYTLKTMIETLRAWRIERRLDLAAMMNTYSSNKDHHRQLILLGDLDGSLVSETANALRNSLQLEDRTNILESDVRAFEQVNTAASRKQVAPLLTQFLQSI
ncbi:DEKNAAC104863 [Brettanomyces naardenensis]|uniref:DEKNAAC104863 n=1 Tax=Brettanomyces naardenensis TaxID=13370 RepID=A0A448YRW8_BRENA|nr:DEKNAAC104863 [Brettanomyces naardenensis]